MTSKQANEYIDFFALHEMGEQMHIYYFQNNRTKYYNDNLVFPNRNNYSRLHNASKFI